MITAIRNLYLATDIPGEVLCTPLKLYHGYFAKKIAHSICLNKLAWITGNVTSGFFAYPSLGAVASFGLLIKAMYIPSIRKSSESIHRSLDVMQAGIFSRVMVNAAEHTNIVPGMHEVVVCEFKFEANKATPASVEESFKAIKNAVNQLSSQFKRVNLAQVGAVCNGVGAIIIQLRVNIPIDQKAFYFEIKDVAYPSHEIEFKNA